MTSDRPEDHFYEFMRELWPETSEHLERTPERVTEMYRDFFTVPYPQTTTFPTENREMVIVKDIPFYSICAHHWLPFFGTATVGYIPDGCILGLSKIPRLLDYFSHRPQVQEELTSDLADHLLYKVRGFLPSGVGVLIEATHFCMEMRGVQKPGVKTRTSALRGSFKTDASQRAEFLQLARN